MADYLKNGDTYSMTRSQLEKTGLLCPVCGSKEGSMFESRTTIYGTSYKDSANSQEYEKVEEAPPQVEGLTCSNNHAVEIIDDEEYEIRNMMFDMAVKIEMLKGTGSLKPDGQEYIQ